MFTVVLTFSKETPGTFRYDLPDGADPATAPVTSLYIRKSAFRGKANPTIINVTVDDHEAGAA